jgi:hypothetical protein
MAKHVRVYREAEPYSLPSPLHHPKEAGGAEGAPRSLTKM